MESDSTDRAPAWEHLSALVDGELGDTHSAHACSLWGADAEARASWHAYQLIGDVLRSEDLACAPGHDSAFLVKLRSRLADEPVVLAPRAVPPRMDEAVPAGAAARVANRRAWRTPVAAAAGFVAVVGVVVATRFTPVPGAPALARAAGDADVVATATTQRTARAVSVAAQAPAVDARGRVASDKLIRDVRLDRYLSAHKQFAGSSALGVPSGFLRNATADAADR